MPKHTMNASISNYRGLASACLDISKICLLAGTNGAGKTSAAQALAAALTGEPIPVRCVKKTQAGLLVRSGTANGHVELSNEQGSTTITWPAAKVKTEGQAPFASHFAAGIQSIVNLDDKERVKILTEYLKATPTREDFDKQLASMNLTGPKSDQLWDLIQKQGWDGASAQIKEKGARLKGMWEAAAGDRYGSKKAESWIPEGYSNGLMGQSVTTLAALVTDARDSLEAAIACGAVDDSRRADLEAVAALKAERQQAVTAAKQLAVEPSALAQLAEVDDILRSILVKRNEIQKQLDELPSAKQTTGTPCPNCSVTLQIAGGTLHIADMLTPDVLATRQTAIDEVQVRLNGVNDAIAQHMVAKSKIQANIKEEEKSNEQAVNNAIRLLGDSTLAEQELSKPVGKKPDISVEDCRRTLAAAEQRMKAFKAKTEADLLHETIGVNTELYGMIAPEGIRGEVLTKALHDFNDSMVRITTAAGWRSVTLESDFLPCYGGTQYPWQSKSEQFRVQVVLQLAMAAMDRSQAVIIDAADILDKIGRNGLFKAVKAVGIPALIAMTIDSKELVPDLGKAGLGASYWINDAVAERIKK